MSSISSHVFTLDQQQKSIHGILHAFIPFTIVPYVRNVFSERERELTFAICYRPSVCRLPVCNARAPYSAG